MPIDSDEHQGYVSAAHETLLRLAGRAPDDLLARCRLWLADGAYEDLARSLAFAALAQRITLSYEDVMTLTELLEAAGGSTEILDEIEVVDDEPPSPYTFTAAATDGAGGGAVDDVDRVALDTVGSQPGGLGLWRAWRHPADGSPWPPPRRVYLVEAEAHADLPALAARVQRDLASAGEQDGQVEVYPTGADLPVYHRLARGTGALLWAATPEREIRVARVFDAVDPDRGPSFHPDHPRLVDSVERGRVLEYLGGGTPVLVTMAQMDDIVDRSRVGVVPMSFRTDGSWIWTDTVSYYLDEYDLCPDEDLLSHIREAGYQLPRVDGPALHRVMAVLMSPPTQKPAWTVGDSGRPEGESDVPDVTREELAEVGGWDPGGHPDGPARPNGDPGGGRAPQRS